MKFIKAIAKLLFQKQPLVSLCMTVKNGMPYLIDSLESIRSQTYKNIELVIQDCCSSDGTIDQIIDFSKRVKFPVHLISETDEGVADALNRTWKRAHGEILMLADADNALLPNHVKTGVKFLLKNPDTAIAYTSHKIIDEKGNFLNDWIPNEFDFSKVVNGELTPPSGSMIINKQLMINDLWYNTAKELGHVPDFDFWLRIGYKAYKVQRLKNITYCTRISQSSGSCQIHRYDEFINSKFFAAKKFFSENDLSNYPDLSLNKCLAGILTWASYHIYSAEGKTEKFTALMKEAYKLDPSSKTLKDLCIRSNFIDISII